ncbi:4Fe-4S dicluster domain-containing protein [uncultured Desulfuromonas sp.]|uniref:4Fe-4S dicluster domain-containing protein n=1 Tax=uncultured Desulfuromonas sp. TaxID=181013 RepID=UPI00261B276F|nr:4Fe-4S dicluster domain-containing protein [uncultured Desulfuromonas sp.]
MKKNNVSLEGLKNEGLENVSTEERRSFLKMGLAVTGVFAGGTIFSATSSVKSVYASAGAYAEKYPYKPHYGMVIHQDRCIDCERCLQACKKTNHVPDYGYRTAILEKETRDAVGGKREFIPVLCNHCNLPQCTRVCPTKATYKDQTTGIVSMDITKCIGCLTCQLGCPYNARYFSEEKHAVDKCNFCFDTRLSKGEKETACAEACPAQVRIFGDLSDQGSQLYKRVHQIEKSVWVLRPEAGTRPNVFYTRG